jgi:hypothetical protein
LTLIPSYPDLPMEKVFPRQPRTDIPQVFLRETPAADGATGRVVYFPWDIDRTFWEVMSPDHGKLLANAVAWASNEPQRVTVIGPGLLDITVWRQKSSVTVHLVNLTNPMMMKGPIREVIPLGSQTVRVRLPDGLRIRSVQLLVANTSPDYRQQGEWLEVEVPSIAEHEVVAIDV